MKDSSQTKFGALVTTGKRIDHPEDRREKRRRELRAAFNRMGSGNDTEAHNAFARARRLIREIGTSFDAILKGAHDCEELREVNAGLGRQLKQVLQENAKFRSMHLPYKIRGYVVRVLQGVTNMTIIASPVVAMIALFLLGEISAAAACLFLVPVGLYHSFKGILRSQGARLLFGSILILGGLICASVANDRDGPLTHRRLAGLVENMNRTHEMGPQTLIVDYPVSHTSLVATVMGTEDTLKITVEGSAAPLEVHCTKYYANTVTVRKTLAESTPAPKAPDIFHSKPVAQFGNCELYAQLSSLR